MTKPAAKREKVVLAATLLLALVVLAAGAPAPAEAVALPILASPLELAGVLDQHSDTPAGEFATHLAADPRGPPTASTTDLAYPETRNRVSARSWPPRAGLEGELSRDLRQGYEQRSGWEVVGSLDAPGKGVRATPWGTRDLATGKFTAGPRAGIDPVDDFIAHAKGNGYEVLGKEISFKTPFETRRVDVVIRDPRTGRIGAIEIKSSPGEFAKLKPEQFAADRYINRFGATAVGENAAQAGVRDIDFVMKVLWEVK